MIFANMFYNLNSPDSLDPFSLFLKLDTIVEVVLPRGIVTDAVLLEINQTEKPGFLVLKLGFDDAHQRIFDDFNEHTEIEFVTVNMN